MTKTNEPNELTHIVGSILHMNYNDACEFAFVRGYTVRMVKVGGNPCIVTRDYKSNRINVDVEDGIMTKVTGIG